MGRAGISRLSELTETSRPTIYKGAAELEAKGRVLIDLLDADAAPADIHTLYGYHDRLLEHKEAMFDHLVNRWRDLFNAGFDLLLYDLTSTYFASPIRRQTTRISVATATRALPSAPGRPTKGNSSPATN